MLQIMRLNCIGARLGGCLVPSRSLITQATPDPPSPSPSRGSLFYTKNRESIQKKQQDYREQHKEHLKTKKKIYYLLNKEKIKQKMAQYRRNSETYREKREEAFHRSQLQKQQFLEIKRVKLKLKQREYYQKNKEWLKAAQKVHYLRNLHLIRLKNRNYKFRNGHLLRLKRRERALKSRKRNNWTDPFSVRKFFETAKVKLLIRETEDWYRVSRIQISKVGGESLFSVFGNLGKALQFAYPEVEWDILRFSFRGKKAEQRWLRAVLELILPPNTQVIEDYLHPQLFWGDGNQRMELDIWVPEYQLALEYQGKHHYNDLHDAFGPTTTSLMYQERDTKKLITCAESSITLATIPYWWDGKASSLASTLSLLRPDVFQPTEDPPIPPHPPKDLTTMDCLMHGVDWDGKQDPSGWFLSEKLDGFRAFWNGSNLISKNGRILSVPLDFTSTLPKGVCLDGEIWPGYANFNKLLSIMRKKPLQSESHKSKRWKNVKFCVFDAPYHPGDYLERHSFAQQSISACGEHISLIPIVKCQGLEHLQEALKEVTLKKGEGVMLYHPNSPYTAGRTNNLLKVKEYKEEEVKFLKCNPNSYSFICEQANGVICIVKCSGWDYMYPPSPGTLLTVKHNGIFKTSQKLKYPYLIRTHLNESEQHEISNESSVQ